MLKASALYIVIIMALVIGIICSSLIVVAYFYRLQYQKTSRYDQLQTNLGSAVNILLAGQDTSYSAEKSFSLFNMDEDSVSTQRIFWGVYDIGVAKAFIQGDTLYKVFSIAYGIDSTKWAALYLADNGRPLGVSGNTMMKGNVYIPYSGIKSTYVNGIFYKGDPRIVIGTKKTSEKTLPPLQPVKLQQLAHYFDIEQPVDTTLLKNDSVKNSFRSPLKYISLGNNVQTIKHINLSGNIILLSDTTLTIDSTAVLSNALVFARSIIVKSGFTGNCQLFAKDSISVGENCRLGYPSCLGLINSQAYADKAMYIRIGSKTTINGLIFTYQKNKNTTSIINLNDIINIDRDVQVNGQIYSDGIIGFSDSAKIHGSIFASRFLHQTAYSVYENYLIDIKIDETALSPYYLTSNLVPVAAKKKKVLQWLEAN